MVTKILAAYPPEHQPLQIESCGNAGGFSGAQLWRLTTTQGELCLRRWPAKHPSAQQLSWMHAIQKHTQRRCGFIPKLLETNSGDTFLHADGHLWELSSWMSGTADFQQAPSEKKLRAAMRALAKFHQAAAEVESSAGWSQGLAERHQFCAGLIRDQLDHMRVKLDRTLAQSSDRLAVLCHELFQLAAPRVPEVAAELTRDKVNSFRLQPCLRDIWHDHVLFKGEEVAGVIDFGAMRTETVTGDIARLLGSLVGDRRLEWQVGLAAYEQVRPLNAPERSVLEIFDRSNVVLSGFNWIRWLFVDERHFPDLDHVVARLKEIRQRLRASS